MTSDSKKEFKNLGMHPEEVVYIIVQKNECI
jgi:hypothetical protein